MKLSLLMMAAKTKQQRLLLIFLSLAECFYHMMHFSAKCGIEIACRPSVCRSVCDVGGSGSHRLEILGN